MNKIFCVFLFFFTFFNSFAQLSADSIKVEEVKTIISFLASDSMKGRGNYKNELHAAAGFISDRFYKAGLKTFPGLGSYFQSFGTQGSEKTIKDSEGRYIPKNILLNVIGVLEGKSKPAEVIIFCAHYDHVGVVEGEIYNGANDNASGTTAMLLLADYFSKRGDNERTIVFCAFAGEELGLKGSSAFVPFLNAEAIKAVINIEMIGINTGRKNSFFITGENYSDLKKIFVKNLNNKKAVRKEADVARMLFERSDNFPFARKGIPAHTIMTSDDSDKCYHKPCDDVKRIDFVNMSNVIRAIIRGSEGLINGKDTPSRVKVEHLK